MEINDLKINLQKIGSKINNNKPLANLNEPIKDTFVRSNKKEFNNTNSNIGFSTSDLSAIYTMREDRKEPDFLQRVESAFSKLPKGEEFRSFQQNKYEPKKEFTIKTATQETGIADKNGYINVAKMYKFDADSLDVIEETSRKCLCGTDKNHMLTTVKDIKNNKIIEKDEIIDKKLEAKLLQKQVVTYNDKNGKVIKKEIMTKSEVNGLFDIKIEYPDGKEEQISKATYNPKTGITTVKKDMKSGDGTRTQVLYENDKKGNKIIDYKITDKDGNVLMNNSQTFEVLGDNHFISSKNSYKYDIKFDDKNLTVKNLNQDREVTLNFKKKCKKNVGEIINLLKKVPGEELFETVDCITKMNGNDKSKLLESGYEPTFKTIDVVDDLLVFLHELGHAKDNATNTGDEIYTSNKKIRNAYLEERKNFNNQHADAERQHISYFIQDLGHYGGEWGGLSEVVAETNALFNTPTSENTECTAVRSQYLQQHFPKTIAAISEEMRWKEDLFSIEFYGT